MQVEQRARRSIDSAISLSYDNPLKLPRLNAKKPHVDIPILKAELGNPFTSRPHSATLLPDEDEELSLHRPSPRHSLNWNGRRSPVNIMETSSFRSWDRQPKPGLSFACAGISQKKTLWACAFALIVMTTVTIGLTLHFLFRQHAYDGRAGPRGAIPAALPGDPLPVLGVLNLKAGSALPVYFGASIDWTVNDPQHFNQDLGLSAAIQDAYFYLDQNLVLSALVNSSGIVHSVDDIFKWTADLIAGTGAIMSISVIPLLPLHHIPNDTLYSLAMKCSEINDIGVPILLRFAPEMNGNWYPYGQDPVAFKTAFTTLTSFVRNVTNDTAMVWAPASGLGYPYSNAHLFGSSRSVLDTDGNGIIDSKDDPYFPYYPGDEYVDWVGLSIFYTSPSVSTVFFPLPNSFPSDDLPFRRSVNFTYNNTIVSVNSSMSFESQLTAFDFYANYSSKPHQPFILSSTGAGFWRENSRVSEAEFKRAWYTQIINQTLLNSYPLVRAVIMYNYETPANYLSRAISGSRTVDFGISRNPNVVFDFLTVISPLVLRALNRTLSGYFVFANATAHISNGVKNGSVFTNGTWNVSLPELLIRLNT